MNEMKWNPEGRMKLIAEWEMKQWTEMELTSQERMSEFRMKMSDQLARVDWMIPK